MLQYSRPTSTIRPYKKIRQSVCVDENKIIIIIIIITIIIIIIIIIIKEAMNRHNTLII